MASKTEGTMTYHDLNNNESVCIGYWFDGDHGIFTALTRTQSRDFKTEKGAVRWLARMGYNADGTRAA